MYKITITPEDPCGPDDKIEAGDTTLLSTFAGLLTKIHEETDADADARVSDILVCLVEICTEMEGIDGADNAESKYIDMDPAYSFTVTCERVPA